MAKRRKRRKRRRKRPSRQPSPTLTKYDLRVFDYETNWDMVRKYLPKVEPYLHFGIERLLYDRPFLRERFDGSPWSLSRKRIPEEKPNKDRWEWYQIIGGCRYLSDWQHALACEILAGEYPDIDLPVRVVSTWSHEWVMCGPLLFDLYLFKWPSDPTVMEVWTETPFTHTRDGMRSMAPDLSMRAFADLCDMPYFELLNTHYDDMGEDLLKVMQAKIKHRTSNGENARSSR